MSMLDLQKRKRWSFARSREMEMTRDEAIATVVKLARAIKDRLGALSNAQQVRPIGELMTRVQFNEARASLKE